MNTTQLGQNALDVASSANFGHHGQSSLVCGDCNKIDKTSVRAMWHSISLLFACVARGTPIQGRCEKRTCP